MYTRTALHWIVALRSFPLHSLTALFLKDRRWKEFFCKRVMYSTMEFFSFLNINQKRGKKYFSWICFYSGLRVTTWRNHAYILLRKNILVYILELVFENSGRNSWRMIYPTFHRNIQELLDEITHLENAYAKRMLLKPFIEKRYNHQDEMLKHFTLIN